MLLDRARGEEKVHRDGLVRFPGGEKAQHVEFAVAEWLNAVSYTHLTLPTTPYV